MKRPDKDASLLELVREASREQRTPLRVQADPSGAEKHGRQGIGQAGHEADD